MYTTEFDAKKTTKQFNEVVARAKELCLKKALDYGDSWKILRSSSLTDQIYLKAIRVRSIQEKKKNEVGDPLDLEFVGMINYSVFALLSLEKRNTEKEFGERFDLVIADVKKLMERKNADYGEAWRNLRISSMVDLILQKILRLQSIEGNDGVTIVSENAASSYQDIINYAIFCLIRISDGADPMI